jgi:AcrR family transcriptional regulator
MTIQESKKYRDIILTAKELFFKFGTKRVTIEEICSEAKVSKMTFYKFFKNKNMLAKQILDDIFEKAIDEFKELMASEVPFKEKIKKVIKMKISKTKQYSDIFFQELIKTNDELRDFITQKRIETAKLIETFFKEGQKEGILRNNINPGLFMYYINHLTEMLDDENYKLLIPDIHARLEEVLNFFFYGIMNSER